MRAIIKYICTCWLFQCGSWWFWHEGNKYICMCWLFQCGSCWIWHEGNKYVCMCWLFQCASCWIWHEGNKYVCMCWLFQCASCWIWHEGNKYVCMCWLFQCGGQPDVLVCHLPGKANPLTFWQRQHEQQTVACKLLETGLISMVLICWRCCCSAKF